MINRDWFKCILCRYAEKRKLPDYVKVSQTPCPECGGITVRVS